MEDFSSERGLLQGGGFHSLKHPDKEFSFRHTLGHKCPNVFEAVHILVEAVDSHFFLTPSNLVQAEWMAESLSLFPSPAVAICAEQIGGNS